MDWDVAPVVFHKYVSPLGLAVIAPVCPWQTVAPLIAAFGC